MMPSVWLSTSTTHSSLRLTDPRFKGRRKASRPESLVGISKGILQLREHFSALSHRRMPWTPLKTQDQERNERRELFCSTAKLKLNFLYSDYEHARRHLPACCPLFSSPTNDDSMSLFDPTPPHTLAWRSVRGVFPEQRRCSSIRGKRLI